MFQLIKITLVFALVCMTQSLCADTPQPIDLKPQPGFFRFSFEDVSMPQAIDNMGLLGILYFADVTPDFYAGVGGYGSLTGSQGGLFVLGFGGGYHHKIISHFWGDAGVFVGGGGGRASLVGGGFMVRPYAGIAYEFPWARLGVHYSYVDFTSGQIRSSQVGVDLDIPFDFYYTDPQGGGVPFIRLDDLALPFGKRLAFQRNDFSLLLQAYDLKPGTIDLSGEIQDGTMGLVGAELDHYVTDRLFWSVKMAGAFSGIKNGYMDILGGLGYHWQLERHGLALVPQASVGMGGGGNVNTGGGVLLQPQLGLEVPISYGFTARVNGGYLWAPDGNLSAATLTGMIIYHMDVATGTSHPVATLTDTIKIQDWQFELFNQTYLRPQRAFDTTVTSPINLVVFELNQRFSPWVFMCYQAASAYSGVHAGGYATGMIGPGIQSAAFYHQHWQVFAKMLVGAGGGGGLALGGGALIEPVLGLHYAFNPAVGVQTSVSQMKSLQHDLNTTVVNVGLTLQFGTALGV